MTEHYELNQDIIEWLDELSGDYKLMAIDDQVNPSSKEERTEQIAESPHTVQERRALIMDFCYHFNMPLRTGVREAIRLIGEWQDLKK